MLTPSQISQKIAEMPDSLSAENFERWFRRESQDFHRYADKDCAEAIFEVENVLSEYHLGTLDESSVVAQLANAIRPFVPVVRHFSRD